MFSQNTEKSAVNHITCSNKNKKIKKTGKKNEKKKPSLA